MKAYRKIPTDCGELVIAAGLVFLLTAPLAWGATVTWVTVGPSTNDWSNTNNWSTTNIPAVGDDVIITNANVGVLLTNSTAELASLLMTNKCNLIFSNWDTALSATNVTILNNSVVTIATAFSNDPGASNNIYIVCSNLTVGAGGKINADRLGYIANNSSNNSSGYGPGAGGYATYMGGGGYGGRGGRAAFVAGGYTYGDVSVPIAPGSSAGRRVSYTSYGDGGGAIRIEALGTVTISNGTITANGGPVNQDCGGGSGGGIYITCRLITGTGGTVRANGGAGYISAGAGGGGRIAVIYNTNAQSSIAVPSIVFQATPGVGSDVNSWAEPGTLYFPDNYFLTETFRHSGQWSVAGLTNWAPDSLLISNSWIEFPAAGFQLTVSNNLKIVGTSRDTHKLVLTNGTLSSSGDILLDTAALLLKGGSTQGLPALNCGGNLILTNSSALYVFSGPTNDGLTAWGTLIDVTNDVYIRTNAILYLSSHATNGGSAFLRMRNLTIDQGAKIDADQRGYQGKWIANYNTGYGPGRGYSAGAGGYGGQGGGNSSTNYGLTYGDSNAPAAPGSSGGVGGSGYKVAGGSGGGLVRIQASDAITLNGTITANGGPRLQDAGSGSGGGIYLSCRTFNGSSNVILRANGGAGDASRGGGGGGRIAVWRMYDISASAVSNSVSAGSGVSPAAEAGTIVWGQIPVPGTIFTIH